MRAFVVRAILAAAALASLAACASRPQPDPAPTVQAAPPSTPAPIAPTPTGPRTPAPGSAEHFRTMTSDRVYFDFDRFNLREDARATLDRQAQWLVTYPQTRVRIEGHADERGTREYNLALGARRASSVRDYLIARGVAPGRIETHSWGKERPFDPRSNEEAWQLNRNGHTIVVSSPVS